MDQQVDVALREGYTLTTRASGRVRIASDRAEHAHVAGAVAASDLLHRRSLLREARSLASHARRDGVLHTIASRRRILPATTGGRPTAEAKWARADMHPSSAD